LIDEDYFELLTGFSVYLDILKKKTLSVSI